MLFLRKLFHLPGPKELGRSSSNALPSREFTPESTEYCWEDWNQEVKEKFPIRYFFAETLADFVHYKIWFTIAKPISDTHYWLVSHIVPKRRYHMLDLRQPDNGKGDDDVYRYGWRDVPEKMLFAIFNLLDQFVREELPNKYFPTEEEASKDEFLQIQRNNCLEAQAIHHWWTIDRKLANKKINDLRVAWSKAHRARLPEAKEMLIELRKLEEEFEKTTEEMIARLMKIRLTLWT
jgi:hypothetical protein